MRLFDPLSIALSDRFPGWPLVGGGSDGDGADGDASASGSGDAAGGSDPDDGSEGTPDLSDVEAEVARFEAEALGEAQTQHRSSSKGDGADDGEGGEPASSDPLDAFIKQNYNGDRDAFVLSQFESRAEQKRLAAENQSLRERLSAPAERDEEAEVKAARESDAEVLAIDQEIKLIDADQREIDKEQASLQTQYAQLNQKIAKAEGELVHADDIEKPKLLHDLQILKMDRTAAQTDYKTLDSRRLVNDSNKRSLQRDLSKIDREIRQSLAEQEKSKVNQKKLTVQTWTSFKDTFDHLATKVYGMKPGSGDYNYMRESVRTQLAAFIETQDDGLDASGIAEAVGKILGAAEKANLIRKSGKPKPSAPASTSRPALRTPAASAASRTPAARTSPSTSSSPASSKPRSIDDLWDDPNFIRQRAVKAFEAANRSESKRRGLS